MNIKTSKILNILKNKYFIASVIFLLFFLFVSENNLFFTIRLHHEVNKLHHREQSMHDSIIKDSIMANSLKGNPEAIEKYGREHYYMKREDEDLFVIKPVSEE